MKRFLFFVRVLMVMFVLRFLMVLFVLLVLHVICFGDSTGTVKSSGQSVPPVATPVQVQPTIGVNIKQEITLSRPTPIYSFSNKLLGTLYPERKFKIKDGGRKELEIASFEVIELLMLNNYNLQQQYTQLWNTYQSLLKEKSESKPKPKKKSKK